MTYYFARTLAVPFAKALARTRAALLAEGFGVITEIDMQAILQAKLGVRFRPYVVLGACNPALAYAALQLEPKVGVMLPCNVIVQDAGDGRTEIAAIDPQSSMQAIDNAKLHEQAALVAGKLRSAVQRAFEGEATGPVAAG